MDMVMEKNEKKLEGIAQTMLLTVYARAKHSMAKNHKFYDEKAIEITNKLDYDFTKASKDTMMSSGTAARTIVFDELIKDYIEKNPDAVIVNIACGLDTRFYRLDNGKITWYNLDLPETIAVRRQFLKEEGRVRQVACSALDDNWPKYITKRGKMLFIIEGLTMYFEREEVAQLLKIIRDNFDNAYVMMETTSPMWVKQEKLEKSVQATGARFKFGANTFLEMQDIAEGFHSIKDDNIIRGMIALKPILKPFKNIPIIKKVTEKILIFEKN
ncbi:MAG: class I SAM-dependent methyltransferase [Lachnospiraceae bacterium]|nr:class I SAM-dependent methyltransferase [Lachnospiraceae bacterium]